MDISPKIEGILKKLPTNPGVYLMKKGDDIIYVGKAKNLKNRVKSYFQQTEKQGIKTQKMVEQIDDIEWVEVNSETEALFLETNYIKEHRPKYNILMKDDKHFTYLKINLVDDFPELQIVREIKKDGAKYFGPKSSKGGLLDTLEFLKKLFPIHFCKNKAGHPCVEYQMHKSVGPCLGVDGREEYRKNIEGIIQFFEGKYDGILDDIRKHMMNAAMEKKFEKAAKYRDLMQTVENIQKTQLVSDTSLESRDVIGVFHDLGKTFVSLFQVRAGKMIHNENYTLQNEGSFDEMIFAFITEFYAHVPDMPKEILIPQEMEDQCDLEAWFEKTFHTKVKILAPQKGKKNELIELAMANAKGFAERERARWMSDKGRMEQAQKDIVELINQSSELRTQNSERDSFVPSLAGEVRKGIDDNSNNASIFTNDLPQGIASSASLPRNDSLLHLFPKRMECFDISHFQGAETVASLVVFLDGEEAKSEYRHYKLKTLEAGKIDDFASMEEILTRRLLEIENQLSLQEHFEVPENFSLRKLKKKEMTSVIPVKAGIQSDNTFAIANTIDSQSADQEPVPPLPPLDPRLRGDDNNRDSSFYALFKGEDMILCGEIRKHDAKILELQQLFACGEVEISTELEKYFFTLLYEQIAGKDLWVLTDEMGKYETFGLKKLKTLESGWQKTPGLVPVQIAEKSTRDTGFAMKIRIAKKEKSEGKIPDFLLIDGGKGQLSSVVSVFEKQRWDYHHNAFWKDNTKIIVCSLAKREEEVFFPYESDPRILPNTSEGSYLLQRLRNEAHRFAITYNRGMREKTAMRSALDDIQGVGPVMQKKLLKTFGSVAGIQKADFENLKLCVGETSAKIIKEFFDKNV